ncbi:MAG: conjugal transfer protein TraF [Deltaproteobacteria bacterium]|nr:conjugal transfer protein TraF [Deltaproteobacteria bacterium]
MKGKIVEAKGFWKKIFVLACYGAVIFFASDAWALKAVGAKAVGMSGARIASVDDGKAYYYNPAVYGFFGYKNTIKQEDNASAEGQITAPATTIYKKVASDNNELHRKNIGIGVFDGGVDLQVLPDGERLVGIFENFKKDFEQTTLQGSSEEVALMIRLANAVGKFSTMNSPLVLTNFNANLMNIRWGNWGFSPNVDVYGYAKLADFRVLGAYREPAQIAIQAYAAYIPEAQYYDMNANYYGTDVATTQAINNKLNVLKSNGLLDGTTIKVVAYAVNQQIKNGGLKATDALQALDVVEILTNGTQTAGENATITDMVAGRLVGRAIAIAEFPVSYGYAFDENFSVGGNFKLMRARDYERITAYANGSTVSTDRHQDSSALGFDLGALYRRENYQLGMVARNINSPTFAGADGSSIKLKPELAAGVAWIPFSTLTVEANYDITKQERHGAVTEQFLSLGAEFDIFRFLALRAGIANNLAASERDLTYSAGVGFNFWLMRVDFGASMAGGTIAYEGKNYPKNLQLALNVEADF